ncbi:hypothetical protein BD770DRAFT_398719 [Pilaira anomala]|nr:hypothetical protein BD770DRAFT_398719 [Pilaira anomala]
MSNPFTQNDLEILKEAFPTLSESVIDDILHSCRGEVNQAFEMLLSMSDSTQFSPPVPPQLPNRPNSFPNQSLNPFTQQNNNNAKPLLTVREELAQWRQDLVIESKRRAEEICKASNSHSDLSFSNLFRSSSSQISNRRRTSNHHAPPSISAVASVPCFQSPVTYRIPQHSSTSNNYTSHHRSNSNPSTRFQPSVSSTPPALPVRRRQSSNSVNSCNQNNPFLTNDSIHRPSPLVTRQSENEASFNPFEEPEQPPPAYNEIQKDTIIDLSP